MVAAGIPGGNRAGTCLESGGNQLTSTPANLTWNALNQPITVNSTTATYDALGRMVEKGSGGTYTQFVFRPSGAILAVYSGGLVKGTIPLPGGSTAIYNSSGLNFIRHKDWLGSSRLATTWAHAVYSKEAYAPFGETYNEAGTPDRSFTGQDQDVAPGTGGAGVYDFLFRKYDPSAGRWLSPDPYGWGAVDVTTPQSLNRYAYVQNNPMGSIDPSGLVCISSDGSYDNSYDGPASGCNGTFQNGYIGDGGMTLNEALGLPTASNYGGSIPQGFVPNIGTGNQRAFEDPGVWTSGLSSEGPTSFKIYATLYEYEYEIDGWYHAPDLNPALICNSDNGSSIGCLVAFSGPPPSPAPSKDVPLEYDIFHCPSCVNTWKQSDCVVNKPFNTVKDDLVVGATGAAFFGGVAHSGTGAGSILKGAANYVGKEALGAVAVATTYLHAITSTAYALVAGCSE
jgi:RHS repeat-associated protein